MTLWVLGNSPGAQDVEAAFSTSAGSYPLLTLLSHVRVNLHCTRLSGGLLDTILPSKCTSIRLPPSQANSTIYAQQQPRGDMAYAITTQPTPCIYHRQGRCVHGVRCKFSHSQSEEKPSHPVPISHRNDPMAPQHFVAPIVVAGQAICEFYKRGSCKFGDTCHYLHPRSAAGVANAPSSSLRATASAFSPTQGAASAKVAVRDTSSQPFGPCRFFAHGRCTKGTACPFPHPTSVKSTGLPLLQSSEPSPKHRVSGEQGRINSNYLYAHFTLKYPFAVFPPSRHLEVANSSFKANVRRESRAHSGTREPKRPGDGVMA